MKRLQSLADDSSDNESGYDFLESQVFRALQRGTTMTATYNINDRHGFGRHGLPCGRH